VCTKAQENLRMLNQAVHCQPGIPGRTADLIGNDLTAVAHQFITISSVCNALEKKLNDDWRDRRRELVAQQAQHEAYQGGLHTQLTKANMTIDDLQARVRHLEQHIAKLEKNPKGDIEAKAQKLSDKVNNQKRRINEQQAQIEVCLLSDTKRQELYSFS
jgi:chromosome segregation ATPase